MQSDLKGGLSMGDVLRKHKLPTMRLGNMREWDLAEFSNILRIISNHIGFKLSARGWAYQLEGFGIIDKSEFDRIQKLINECRKKGYLSINFVAAEKAREFEHVFKVTEESPREKLLEYINDMYDRDIYHIPDYWEGEKYYLQVLVEKIDLVTLFEDVCKNYRIPIATSKGWSSISQRAELIERFKYHEEQGRIPVLLYCGDFDPAGLAISDMMKKNFNDLYRATKWNPYRKLIVDRFGLNKDYIEEHGLTWIDNLVTGSGREADESKPMVADYIAEYGRRKCEANALVVRPQAAKKLMKDTIEKYLGSEGANRFSKKDTKISEEYKKIMDEIDDMVTDIISTLEDEPEDDE